MAIELERIGWEDAPSEQTPIDSGNLKQMENNTEDAINKAINQIGTTVETSTGNYIKFDSGLLIQYGRKRLPNVSITSDYYGSCKRGPEGMVLGNFPIKFIDVPIVSIIPNYTAIWLIINNSATANSLPTITLCAPQVYYSTINVDIDYIAIGKWK